EFRRVLFRSSSSITTTLFPPGVVSTIITSSFGIDLFICINSSDVLLNIFGFVIGPLISISTGTGEPLVLLISVLAPLEPNSTGNVLGNVKLPTYACNGLESLFGERQYGSVAINVRITF